MFFGKNKNPKKIELVWIYFFVFPVFMTIGKNIHIYISFFRYLSSVQIKRYACNMNDRVWFCIAIPSEIVLPSNFLKRK